MDHIVLNRTYTDLKNTSTTQSNRDITTIFIKSLETKLPISEGSNFVSCRSTRAELTFLESGTISQFLGSTPIPPSIESVNNYKTSGGEEPRTSYRHGFRLQVQKELKGIHLLSELEYSLKSVKRYSKPVKHFERQYRELEEKDYETIINGWIYTARTTFGMLVNALPRQNRLEFMLQAMNNFQTIEFEHVPLYDGLKFLNDYIKRRIISRGSLLVATEDLLEKNLRNILNPKEIGFKHPETNKEDLISDQAAIFKKIFQMGEKADFISPMNRYTAENMSLEMRFKKIFDKTSWPIDLSV